MSNSEDENSLAGKIYAVVMAFLIIDSAIYAIVSCLYIYSRDYKEPIKTCTSSYYADRGWAVDPKLDTLDEKIAREKAGSLPIYIKEDCIYEQR